MNCKNVQASLSAYIDRELGSDDMQAIREHLFDCSACKDEEASLNSLKQLLRGVRTVEPAADFESRLAVSVFGHSEQAGIPHKISYAVVSAVAAAAMLTTLTLLSALGRHGEPQVANGPSHEIISDISHDRAYDVGSDPLSGSPVVMPMNYDRP